MLIEYSLIKLPIKLPLRTVFINGVAQPKLFIILVNLLETEANLLLWAYGNWNHYCSGVYCKIHNKIGKIKRLVSIASHSKMIDDTSTSIITKADRLFVIQCGNIKGENLALLAFNKI